MIKVRVRTIGADSFTGSPILLLENIENKDEIFPIWIGIPEAEGIIMYQADIKTPRPMTYDLIKSIIQSLGASVEYVAVIDKQNNIYIAEIVLEDKEGNEIKVDARPSDAINIALRFNVPIYLNENVVQSINIKDIQKMENGKDNEVKDAQKILDTEEEDIKDVKDLEETVNKLEAQINSVKTKNDDIDEELRAFRKFLENVKPEDFDISKKKKKNNK
ncbi:MAG: bifunctional nuclease family protein [Persephonella sp.]|nr:MAG: bifunctional nuclease family protein [Persephonella sp.]